MVLVMLFMLLLSYSGLFFRLSPSVLPQATIRKQGAVSCRTLGSIASSYTFSLHYRRPQITEESTPILLNATEEVRLAREYRLSVVIDDICKDFIAKNGRPPSDKELVSMFQMQPETLLNFVQRGEAAKESLLDSNMRLVYYICSNYRHSGVPWDDLVLDGCLGLNKAVDRFDPSRGCRFGTYATWWIKMTVSQGVTMRSEKTKRLPSHMVEHLRTLSKVEMDLREELGREPSSLEIAFRMAISVKKVGQLLASRHTISLSEDLQFSHDKSGGPSSSRRTIADTMASTSSSSPLAELLTKHRMTDAQEVLANCMSCLDEKEQYIIRNRYGLIGEGKPKSLVALGEEFGLRRTEVRLIQLRAIAKIKKYYETNYRRTSSGEVEEIENGLKASKEDWKLLPWVRD